MVWEQTYQAVPLLSGETGPNRVALPTSAAWSQGSELASNAAGCPCTERHLQTRAEMGLDPEDYGREEQQEWNQGARGCNAVFVLPCQP